MQFNTYEFLIFFPVVVLVYFIIPLKVRHVWLLAASYYFYMSWNPRYALLMVLSTGITYVSGVLMEKINNATAKKIVLAVSLISSLGILAVFKYSNFIIANANAILNAFHVGRKIPDVGLLLPVGISFYTFQALGYSIDVYRGDIPAEHNFVRYALFVAFFPQLVAGPIERSGNLLKQVKKMGEDHMLNYQNITSGLMFIVWGLFLKMVIADRAAILVNTVFDHYYLYGAAELSVAVVGFAVQIYCDFASYSTVAVGAARVLGVRLMENFDTPYFSRSIKEFWRRWHISLSTWFRDYLYIPLGGGYKCSIYRKNINRMIVFLASGLWHGPSYNFVIWGALHGLFQTVDDATRARRQSICQKWNIQTGCFSWKLLQMAITFLMVNIAWIFFRAETMVQALGIIKRMFTKVNPWAWFDGTMYNLGLSRLEWKILIVALMVLFIVSLVKYRTGNDIAVFLSHQNLWFRWFVIFALTVSIFIYGIYGPNVTAEQFIYFQF